MADTRSARLRIFDAAMANGWRQEWNEPDTHVTFYRGSEYVSVLFTAPGYRNPVTGRTPAQRVKGAYATTRKSGHRGTLAITGKGKALQVISRLSDPR